MFDIISKVYEYKASKQRVYPCHVNRASSLGHPCERYLVYMRTMWDKMELPDVEREFIFAGGRLIEDMAVAELKDAGIEITNQGRDYFDEKYKISGHVDCFVAKVEDDKKPDRFPCEIKGISPFDFNKINSVEDMLKSRNSWTKAYPAQLQLYMFLAAKDEGLFYIKSKVSFVPKQIWVKLDYGYCEELLQKCERINKHVAEGTLPEKIVDYQTCKKCQAKHFCRPDIVFGEGIGFLDDLEVEKKLDRREETSKAASEYKSLDAEIKEGLKDYMKDRSTAMCGKWLIEKKVSANKAIRFNFTRQ